MENDLPKRKPLRLPAFDYSENAYYFVTICTKDRLQTLGRIVGSAYMPTVHTCLSQTGKVAERNLLAIENHFPAVHIEKFVIMPNHLHCILSIGCNGTASAGGIYAAPTLSRVISTYKASVSRHAGFSVWQRSFYEHIIRGQQDYKEIWQYIDNNPLKWVLDGKSGSTDTNSVF